MHGLGNTRHTPSASHIRRADTSGPIANLRPVLSPAGQARTAPVPDRTNTSGGVLHFFSMPHWTRRILPVSSARKSLAGLPHADMRAAPPTTPPRRLLLDKDLPPIPPLQGDANIASHEPSARSSDASAFVPPQQVSDAVPPPTFYLDVYHNTPMIPSSSQVNSVAFTPLSNNRNESVLRKTKSTHSLQSKQPSPSLQQLRTRGISMTQIFATAKRGPPSPCATDGNPPSTRLVRKSSFWSRKSLKPASPLRIDITTPPDSLERSRSISSGAGASGCRSDRAVRDPTMTRTNIPSFPYDPTLPDKTNVRPSTADPYVFAPHRSSMRRPATADSAATSGVRARSFFDLSQKSTYPPSNNEPSSDNPVRRLKTGQSDPRPRSSTNPPLLHRLSINLFASSPSPTGKNGAVSSPSSRSPRPSLSQIPPDTLKPRTNESSETFVNRLVSLVSKADITTVLASTGEPIYTDSLHLFMERFRFSGEPLDVALRRLLMDVGLPRETQQIDRVIEAFANRYLSCNPDLFTSRDHPYILAFSLIMLHTDAFNKSNKRKMSKADYIRNTTLPGLIPEVLDCFYDNIVFAPFIFIEESLDSEGNIDGTRPSTASGLPSPMMQSGNVILSRPKIDPYYLITNNLLDQLHVNVEGQISLENPFRWDGTGTSWNYDEIFLSFSKGQAVQIGSTDVWPPFFGLSVGGAATPSVNGLGGAPETPPTSHTWSIKLTKIAVLNRKDDLLEGGKKPLNRKWRPYSVALTRSQLLLFRDLSWSSTLLSWEHAPKKLPIPSSSFKPDEIISLNDALAVLDRSYSKHLNTFRLATRDGRHILFRTTEEKELNEWISRINYASAFRTAGIRMRSLGMTGKALELTGVAAATSHIHDLRLLDSVRERVSTRDHCNPAESTNKPLGDAGLHGRQGELVDLSIPGVEGGSQCKGTFNTVKAKLAAASTSVGQLPVSEKTCPLGAEPSLLTPRAHTIHARVEELESRIYAANAQIDSSMHVARNIAILAPFQRSTRERLQDSIQTISKKIQAVRLDVTKLICHRNILLNDLAVEETNFKHATSLALQAATETLQQRCSEYMLRPSFPTQEFSPKNSSREETSTGSQSFDSTTSERSRSALDFGPDWPSSGEAFAAPSILEQFLATGSPMIPGHDCSAGSYLPPDETSYLLLSTTDQSLLEASLQRKSVVPDPPEEQAEEWHKTKAAKRVSLIKLPSDLQLSAIPGKSSTVGDVAQRT